MLAFCFMKTHKQVAAIKPNSLHWVFSITTPLSLSGVSGFCFFASNAQHFSKMYIKYAQSHQPSSFNLFNMASATYPPPTKKLALSRSLMILMVLIWQYFVDLSLTSQQHLIQSKPPYHYSLDWCPWYPHILTFPPKPLDITMKSLLSLSDL